MRYNPAMNSNVVLPLESMTVAEKLEVLDKVWDDLRKNASKIPVPEWHLEILASRRRAVESGEVGYTDWETAKKQIRMRVS